MSRPLQALANQLYLPVRVALTAPVSIAACAVNYGYSKLPHRHVEWNWNAEHWVLVCCGAPTSLGAGATTFGAVVNTKHAYAEFLEARDGRLIVHEAKHTDQWAIFGSRFAVLYVLAAVWDWFARLGTGGKLGTRNAFEIWAGLEDGGYR